MFDDIVINGGRKVPRTPTLAAYDRKKAPTTASADPAFIAQYFNWNGMLDKNAPSTRQHDKALLIELGVNGEVPFFRAAENAGLPVVGERSGSWFARRDGLRRMPANDNTKSAAIAA